MPDMEKTELNARSFWVNSRCDLANEKLDGREDKLAKDLEEIAKRCCCGYCLFLADLLYDMENHPFAAVWALHTVGPKILNEAANHGELAAASETLSWAVSRAHAYIYDYKAREEAIYAGKYRHSMPPGAFSTAKKNRPSENQPQGK